MFGLSLAGPIPLYTFIIFILTTIIFSVTVTNFQTSAPSYLPRKLQNWNFLPIWLHSLEPWDELVMGAIGCCCRKKGWNDDALEEVIIKKKTSDATMFPTVAYNTITKEHSSYKQNSFDSFTIPTVTESSSNFLVTFTDVPDNQLHLSNTTPIPAGLSNRESFQERILEWIKLSLGNIFLKCDLVFTLTLYLNRNCYFRYVLINQ